jgi:hypothetical protein
MEETNKKAPIVENNQLAEQTTTSTEVTTPSNNNFDISAMLEASTQLDKAETILTLSAEAISLDKVGESFRGIFIGFGTMTVTDDKVEAGQRTIPSAKFLINKQVRINAGVVLINELKNANVVEGTKLEVTYTKKDGNVKIYSISLLN